MNRLSEFSFVEPITPEDWNLYLQLRWEVLRKPWDQPFSSTTDDQENISFHLLVKDGIGHPAATGRLQFNNTEQGQIRSMAVREDLRSMGLGSVVLGELEKVAKLRGLKEIILDARKEAVAFYEKNGYRTEGDSYILFGVIPHFRMIKKI